MKRFGSLLGIFIFTLGFFSAAQAQEVKLSAHMGALGVGSSTSIGYGAALQIAPYETVGLRLDATTAKISGENYFSSTPMVVWFVPTTEEFKAGVMFGAGFHKIPTLDMKFGIGGGASADFMLSKNMSVGGIILIHNVLTYSGNVWSTMITFSTSFGQSSSWDW